MGAYKTIGELAYGVAEQGAKKFSAWIGNPDAEKSFRGVIDKTFGLESTLTGKSGEYAKFLLAKYDKAVDYHLNLETRKAFVSKTLKSKPELDIAARKAARNQVFGQQDEILAGVTQAMRNEHGDIKAANFVDNIGVRFHEEALQNKAGSFGTRTTKNLSSNMLTEDLELNAPKFKARKPGLETLAHAWGSAALAFKASLSHLSTPLNGLIGNSLESFAKATPYFFGEGFENAKAEIQSYNALGAIWSEELGQMYAFRSGIINKFAPNTFGEFVSKNWMIPGFSALRQRTATMFAMQGKFSALEYASNLMSADIDVAEKAGKNLEWMGLNPKKIKSNGGQLTPEDISQAMYENANQKMFLDRGGRRSYYAQVSPLGRLTTMYHSYGSGQANFIQRELYRQIVINKDPVAAAKTMAILGIIFPAVGASIEGAKQVWMHPGKADEKLEETMATLERLGTTPAIMERLEGISNVAGFGIMSSYTRAAGRRKLLNYMAGPAINAAAEAGGDIVAPIVNRAEGKKGSFAPLGRDVLHDIPSLGIGSWAADTLLPTQKDINARKPMTSRRIAAKRAAILRKLKEGKGE